MSSVFEDYVPFVAPEPVAVGNTIEARFPVAVHNLNRQTAAIRAHFAETHDGFRARRAAFRCSVRWGMYLTGAKAAGIFLSEAGVEQSKLEETDGRGGETTIPLYQTIIDALEGARRAKPDGHASIWTSPNSVILRIVMRYRYLGYLVFHDTGDVSPASVRLVEAFGRMCESVVRDLEEAEFQSDQQRLLGRRTIIAELRPNDLLYHVLRKLNKFIPWRRSAAILSPIEEAGGSVKPGASWYIAAERLLGVKEVSGRVGKQFHAGVPSRRRIPQPMIIDRVGACTPKTRWEKMILETILSDDGLPLGLPAAGSALIIAIDRTWERDEEKKKAEAHAPLPLVMILTDPVESRFNDEHVATASAFVSQIGPLLGRSHSRSHQLVHLWTPPVAPGRQRSSSGVDPEVDVRNIDALPPDALAASLPELLALDALQVVQFSRGEISRKDSGELHALVVRAVAQTENPKHPKVTLRAGLDPSEPITPDATLLWSVIESGVARFFKSVAALEPVQVARLFVPHDDAQAYRSAFIFPIRAEDELAGLLIAYRVKTSELIEVDRMLLASLAVRLGERIELRRQVADRARLLSCISAVALADDEQSARNELVTGAREILGADKAFLVELDRDPAAEGAALVAVAQTWPQSEAVVPRLNLTAIEGITGRVFTTRKPVAASDVNKNSDYRPLLDTRGMEVPISSELAVPVIAPLTTEDRETFGVLDTSWDRPHKITPREVSTLQTLGQQAGAVLRLGRSLRDVEQHNRKLQHLIKDAQELEQFTTEKKILQWLSDHLPNLIDFDLGVVWSHRKSSPDLEVISRFGRRPDKMPHQRLSFGGWIGGKIEEFRDSGPKTAVDTYDMPSSDRRQVPGTEVEKHQVSAAFLLRPYERLDTPEDDDVVWGIVIYRFRPFNFDPRETLLLFTAGGHCESALHRVAMTKTQQRTFELAEVSEQIVLDLLVESHDQSRAVIEKVARTIHQELGAHSVAILIYSDPTDVPQTYSYPPEVVTRMPPTRTKGLSEFVRNRGERILVDVKNPEGELREIVRTSAFYSRV